MSRFLSDSVEFLPILLTGVKLTVQVTAGSLAVATVLGLVWALMRVSGVKLLANIARLIVNLIRGIPIIVQLFYIYFVLPDFGSAEKAEAANEFLRSRGIIVRGVRGYGLPTCLRITVGTAEECILVADTLKEFMRSHG